jgi:hypothetical protein
LLIDNGPVRDAFVHQSRFPYAAALLTSVLLNYSTHKDDAIAPNDTASATLIERFVILIMHGTIGPLNTTDL